MLLEFSSKTPVGVVWDGWWVGGVGVVVIYTTDMADFNALCDDFKGEHVNM